jgi:hypothetical protein
MRNDPLGSGKGKTRSGGGPGPLPRYGTSGGLPYMMADAPATQIIGLGRAKLKVGGWGALYQRQGVVCTGGVYDKWHRWRCDHGPRWLLARLLLNSSGIKHHGRVQPLLPQVTKLPPLLSAARTALVLCPG